MNIIENGKLHEVNIKKEIFLYLSDDIMKCYESEPLYFANCIVFINEKGENGLNWLRRTSNIYTNFYYKLEDCLNGIPSQYIDLFNGKFKTIIPSNKDKLLVTVIHDDDFFEVTCKYIKIFYDNHEKQQIWNPVDCQYLSHKYTNEEMAEIFKIALSKISYYGKSPISTYISRIERIPSNFEIKSRMIAPLQSIDKKYTHHLPDWANSKTYKKYNCILSYSSYHYKEIKFKIVRDDFPMINSTSDRDGGFWVYLEKYTIEGQIRFKTIYDVQSYIFKISDSNVVKFTDSQIIPKSGLFPWHFNAEIDYNCSIKDLFSELEVEDVLTERVFYREDIDASDLEKYKNR